MTDQDSSNPYTYMNLETNMFTFKVCHGDEKFKVAFGIVLKKCIPSGFEKIYRECFVRNLNYISTRSNTPLVRSEIILFTKSPKQRFTIESINFI